MENDDLIKEFIVEASEGLDQLDRDLVALEQDPTSKETLSQIFRTIHTIKGSSGFLALPRLESVAHVGENLLSLMRDGKRGLDAEVTSALLAMADAIRDILGNLDANGGEGATDYRALVEHLAQLTTETTGRPAAAATAPAPVTAVPPPAPTALAADNARAAPADTTIRVDVRLLDNLMNLVGELVLARNQILQFTSTQADPAFAGTTQRLNHVTTELQEGVMKTRMQTVGTIWTKFPRVVRDLALACGKKVRIEMEGQETELDKTIVESIKDPLTHAIRNAVDHGIEAAEIRRARGKPEEGCIQLRAFHEGGMVNIEIADDGGGIDPAKVAAKAIAKGLITPERAARASERELVNLVTLPGFSTAEKVTNVSGRGVGMDVVKTNIEKIGGTIDIQSAVGKGTTLKIKIPLTLAIIPALIVVNRGERYAIPQVNLLELVRLESDGDDDGIEYIHGAPVYRLRGQLLPLLYLDRELESRDADAAMRGAPSGAANIVVLQADDRQFGLVVENILDTEEIVVKPLGRQLKSLRKFAGATIMGDGMVALILDVMGFAQDAALVAARARVDEAAATSDADHHGEQRAILLLLGTAAGGRAAIELSTVARLEEFDAHALERTAGREVVQYRGAIMPIVRLSAILGDHARAADAARLPVVVVTAANGRSVGLAVDSILDIVDVPLNLQAHMQRPGVRGAAAVQGRVTELLDVRGILEAAGAGFAAEPTARMEPV